MQTYGMGELALSTASESFLSLVSQAGPAFLPRPVPGAFDLELREMFLSPPLPLLFFLLVFVEWFP